MRDQTMIERSDPPMRREDLPVRQETATDFEPEDTGGFTAPGDGGMGAAPAETRSGDEKNAPMFGPEQTNDFRSRWYEIQTEFIDDPRRCVQRADELVAETMTKLSDVFTQEREKLEREWDRGEDVSTENLRIALQRYRSFFDRLLSF